MAKCGLFARANLFPLVTLLMILLAQNDICEARKLQVEVFYAPMDPKSVEFVRKSLATLPPNILSEHVNLNMYPVAGCTFENSKLACSGGDLEANASLVHSCAFNALSPDTGDKRDAREGLKYIACTMNAPKLDMEGCQHHLKAVKDKVSKCIAEKAPLSSLMARYSRFNPDYKPFVVIDDQHSKTQDQAALKSIMLTICRALEPKAPAECDEVGNLKRAAAGRAGAAAEEEGGAEEESGVETIVAPGVGALLLLVGLIAR